MAREWRRLLITPERLEALAIGCPPQLALEPHESHYLRRVLRLRAGDPFAIADGAGRLWTARLAPMAGGAQVVAQLDQPLAEPWLQEPKPTLALALAIALPKREGDLVLRMACELGLDRIAPLAAERSVAGELKHERCAGILREAAEQCERLWLPELMPLGPAASCLAQAPAGVGLLATTRRPGLPLLAAQLSRLEPIHSGWITIAVGPEGGWTPREEELAIANGWQPVSLGATILRSSTAAVAAATLLSHWRSGLQLGTEPLG